MQLMGQLSVQFNNALQQMTQIFMNIAQALNLEYIRSAIYFSRKLPVGLLMNIQILCTGLNID